jgi:hypothetical protein
VLRVSLSCRSVFGLLVPAFQVTGFGWFWSSALWADCVSAGLFGWAISWGCGLRERGFGGCSGQPLTAGSAHGAYGMSVGLASPAPVAGVRSGAGALGIRGRYSAGMECRADIVAGAECCTESCGRRRSEGAAVPSPGWHAASSRSGSVAECGLHTPVVGGFGVPGGWEPGATNAHTPAASIVALLAMVQVVLWGRVGLVVNAAPTQLVPSTVLAQQWVARCQGDAARPRYSCAWAVVQCCQTSGIVPTLGIGGESGPRALVFSTSWLATLEFSA